MSGPFAMLYGISTVLISLGFGFNWLSGSLLIGVTCAFIGGTGAKGMWIAGSKFPGLIIGAITVGLGMYATQSSGVWISVFGYDITGSNWVMWGAIVLFLLTSSKDVEGDH
jgi:hypothetical protein